MSWYFTVIPCYFTVILSRFLRGFVFASNRLPEKFMDLVLWICTQKKIKGGANGSNFYIGLFMGTVSFLIQNDMSNFNQYFMKINFNLTGTSEARESQFTDKNLFFLTYFSPMFHCCTPWK